MSGVLMVILARAGRRPGRWLLPALGIALAVAFAGAVLVESTVAGTRAARAALSGLSPLDRSVRVTWQGPVTATARAQALGAFRQLGLPPPAEVVLLDPVRLDGILVRPAAIAPLAAWSSVAAVGPCTPAACPMRVAAGGAVNRSVLTTDGVRIVLSGSARLTSDAALGFDPRRSPGVPPVLLTGDVAGLDSLAGLSGVYRSHSWVSSLDTASLTSWQLPGLERRLQTVQASLLAGSLQFTVATPATALDQARTQAALAPHRLLLAGGGAVAAVLLFVVLAAGGLRRDQSEQLARLRTAGARTGHCLAFVAGVGAWLCGLGALAGAATAVGAGAILASTAGVPVGGALDHSLLTPLGIAGLAGGWLVATALLVAVLTAPGVRAADALAVAAVAALALALLQGGSDGGPLALVLVPLACLAAGVLVYRGAALLLQLGERVVRGGPVLGRLAFVGLARAPSVPALAIAFIAVSTGLGGFALVYRATLARGSADEAANQVPLDAIVSAGPDFATPLEVVPASAWRRLAGGPVLAVQRTDASFVSGGASVTVPALGVPASGLTLLHGWRSGELSAAPSVLARRLTGHGPVRVPGPLLPVGTRRLELTVASPQLAVSVTAELRDPAGGVQALPLGAAFGRLATLVARVPAGRWEVEAFELTEPTGLQVTNDHQNGENVAAATQAAVPVALGPVRALAGTGGSLLTAPLAGWQAVGSSAALAAPLAAPTGDARQMAKQAFERSAEARGAVAVTFGESGLTGVVRPEQPSDAEPLPVLTDPQTAAAAGRGGRLGLSVDGLPVLARVVGIVTRFPSVPAGSAGVVVADQARLASALDAQLPGQGRPDELWIATAHPDRLRAALSRGPLAQLDAAFRDRIEHGLRAAPVAQAVLGTLSAAAALCGVLALLGLLVALLGTLRDRHVEADLRGLGLGPRAIRAELRLRLLLAGAVGIAAGLAVALALARLAVAAVRAGASVQAPVPPLVTVVPGPVLGLWAVGAFAAVAVAGWLASRRLGEGAPW